MGKRRRRLQETPHIQPVDVDGVRTASILTVLWAMAFVFLAFNRQRLDDEGIGWLLWTCLAGVGLGLLGIEYTRKRRDAIAQSQLEAEAEDDEDDDAGADLAPNEVAAGHAFDDDVSGQPAGSPTRRVAPNAPARERPETTGHGGTGPAPVPDAIPTKPIPRPNQARSEPKRPQPQRPEPERAQPRQPQVPSSAQPPSTSTGRSDTLQPRTEPPRRQVPPADPPADPLTGPLVALPAQPQPPAGRRRNKHSKGPERPGRVDVGDVSDLAPRIDAPTGDPTSGSLPSSGEISPMWSELIDTTPPRPSSSAPANEDEPLLDTTLGGRRAKHYDMREDIDEITEGGGGVYRGRRARRPDSA